MITLERTYSYEMTKKIALEFKKKNKFDIVFKTLCCKNDDYPTYITYVKTIDGKMITRGNGKGIGKQSELSSVFEAIEHCFYESYFIKNNLKWKKVKKQNIKNVIKKLLPLYAGNPIIENIKDYEKNIKLPCKKFKNIFSNFSIYLPLFMYGPSYPIPALNMQEANYVNSVYRDNEKLNACLYKNDKIENYKSFEQSIKYCSSVGGASGIDFEETLLHALNEIIERDSTSEFLLRSIIKHQYKMYSTIDINSLDESNLNISRYIEKFYDVKLKILDVTGKLGIPTILVLDEENKYANETPLTGSGTSLSLEYAIERALLEYKQTIDLVLYDKTLPKDDNFKEFLLQDSINNFFKDLYYFDTKDLLSNFKIMSFNDLKKKYNFQKNCINPKKMLEKVLDILKQLEYEVLYSDTSVETNSGSIHYIKAFIPQMCDITDPGPLRLPTKRKIEQILKDS